MWRRPARDTQASERTFPGDVGSQRRPAVRARRQRGAAPRAAGGGDAAGRRIPGDPRRADARRQRAAQRRHVREHVDGAPGRAAHRRVPGQEHDRQGRVPPDRGDRVPLRRDPRQPVARARRRQGHGLLDHRVERGRDARRARPQAALAEAARRGGKADGPAQSRDGDQRPGLLGEVRQLLGRRDAPRADGGRALPPLGRGGREALRREHDRGRRDPRLDVRRLVRAREGDLRRAGRPPARDGPRRPGARRRRVGCLRRAVPRPRPRMGLRAPPRSLDQCVGAQVRPRLPGRRLGRVARPGGAARGPDLLGQLPR